MQASAFESSARRVFIKFHSNLPPFLLISKGLVALIRGRSRRSSRAIPGVTVNLFIITSAGKKNAPKDEDMMEELPANLAKVRQAADSACQGPNPQEIGQTPSEQEPEQGSELAGHNHIHHTIP